MTPHSTVPVGSTEGLHARPARIIADKAQELPADVRIGRPGEESVDAGSPLMIMTLGAGRGEPVEISGEDQESVDAIARLVSQDLDA